jgi:hypothetical protein
VGSECARAVESAADRRKERSRVGDYVCGKHHLPVPPERWVSAEEKSGDWHFLVGRVTAASGSREDPRWWIPMYVYPALSLSSSEEVIKWWVL